MPLSFCPDDNYVGWMNDISANFTEILGQIRRAERSCGRAENSVRLVAVTKTQSDDVIKAAISYGHRLFGENRVQEAQAHWTEIKKSCPDVELHLIGPLQTNKVKDAVALFDCIETLDREKLADALSAEMKEQGRGIPCYIQVNTGHEEQKAGIAPEDLGDFIAYCQAKNLRVEGLMCIPPVDDASGLHFAYLKNLATKYNLEKLSMGMSGDFETAIRSGATHVRIGSSLFGSRR